MSRTTMASERGHGTNACYHIDACRCRPCRDAARAYEQHRRRQVAYGRWQPFVDAQPARAHVNELRSRGIGPVTIARLSGVPHGSIAKLLYGDKQRGMGPSRRIRRETAERLLAVTGTLDQVPARAVVDATGTRRRAQALLAIGWAYSEQARRIGFTPTNYLRALTKPTVTVSAALACAVRDLYDDLSMTPGGSARALAQATREALPPPLAWNDEEIDDPKAKPRGMTQGGDAS